MIIPVSVQGAKSEIIIESGGLAHAGEYLELNRRVFILTDSGVPAEYAECVASQSGQAYIKTVARGERSKCFEVLRSVLSDMLSHGLGRGDCLVAVGGGVVGDLGGFAAATYMRGIDFYNIPTTVLAQVDSSVGGKTGIDLDGVKNIVGAFYQPRTVLIDPLLLSTLSDRYVSEGLAEALKMALTLDAGLFSLMERTDELRSALPEIIERSVRIKSAVVEADPFETGLRRVLNFGHTIGHAVESANLGSLLHGECVGLGMLPMCADELRGRVRETLRRMGLPTEIKNTPDELMPYIAHDKKMRGSGIETVSVSVPGSYETNCMTLDEIRGRIEVSR